MYRDGFDFLRDLICDYGKTEALRVANNYLDMQAHIYGSNFSENEPEEFTFCCELYQATKQLKKQID